MDNKLIPMNDGEHYMCIIKATPSIVSLLKLYGLSTELPPIMYSEELRKKAIGVGDILSEIETSDVYVSILNCHDYRVASDKVIGIGACGKTQIYVSTKKELIEYSKPLDNPTNELLVGIKSQFIDAGLKELIKNNFNENSYKSFNAVSFESLASVVFDATANQDLLKSQSDEMQSRIITMASTLHTQQLEECIVLTRALRPYYASPLATSLVFYFDNELNITQDEQD